MKKFLLFLLFTTIFLLTNTYGQTRVVSGRLSDSDGQPLPGVTIIIKGTTKGTVTDIDGYYRIEAPVGSVLVFSYVGFGTREVVVTEEQPNENAQKILKPDNKPGEVKDGELNLAKQKNRPGVAILDKNSPEYAILKYYWSKDVPPLLDLSFDAQQFPRQVYQLKYVSPQKALRKYGLNYPNGFYLIDPSYAKRLALSFRYTTSFSWNRPTRLPGLQHSFAQGLPDNGSLVWRGPETGTPFSWGPFLNYLEFDGTAYPYDENGRLMLLGSGNGQKARAYDPYDFFDTGTSGSHEFDLKFHFKNKWFLNLDYHRLSEKGIVPLAKNQSDHFRFEMENNEDGKLDVKYHLDATGNQAHLNDRGGNLANLFYRLTSTPPSFDNSNGLSGKAAVGDAGTYTTDAGQMRSYHPLQMANPYFLVNKNANSDRSDRVAQFVDFKLDLHPFSLSYKFSYAQSRLKQHFAAFDPGRWSEPFISSHRKNQIDQGYAQLSVGGSLQPFNNSKHRFETLLVGEFLYDQFDFQRSNSFADGSTPGSVNMRSMRRSYNLLEKVSYHFHDILNVELQNAIYLSSTLDRNRYFNPSVGMSIQTRRLPDWMDFISYGKLYSSINRSVSELPVHYATLEFNSLDVHSGQFPDYFEQKDLFYHPGLLPETAEKFEVGAEIYLFYNTLSAEFNYYDFHRNQVIFPSLSGQGWDLVNGADLLNRGVEARISYIFHSYDFRWLVEFNFTRNRSEVKKLHVPEKEIAFAGFADIHKSLIKGQPVGVLVGTRFTRDQQGNTIIGADGYPLVDDQLGIIGDPNPDWTSGFRNSFRWKGIGLSFLITMQKGGDVWNGTRNVLNYHGTSRLTGTERDTRDFIFPGVNSEGKINTVAVNFADPDNDVMENRWVRYGLTGVAEEGIEKGSWLRFQEISLDYEIPGHLLTPLHLSKVSISAIAKNLFLRTSYQGVDPSTSLFGYGHGQGLDLFNLPSISSYGLKLTITI